MNVWPLTRLSADNSTAVVESIVERMLLFMCGRSIKLLWRRKRKNEAIVVAQNECE